MLDELASLEEELLLVPAECDLPGAVTDLATRHLGCEQATLQRGSGSVEACQRVDANVRRWGTGSLRTLGVSSTSRAAHEAEDSSSEMLEPRTALEFLSSADAHCARVLLCDGAQFLGWVGGYHPEPISPVTVARFRRLVPALRPRLRAECLLGLVAGPVDAMLVAALDHVAAPAWVTDLQGRVLAANEAGRAHYDRDPGTTQALLRRPKTAEGAPRVAIHEMNQRGMPALRLVVLESAPPRPESAVPAFAAQHRLTARQTEVLALLVTGASNINIAATLGCTERTVETHLAAIFRRLGCMSRTELVGRVLLSDRENT